MSMTRGMREEIDAFADRDQWVSDRSADDVPVGADSTLDDLLPSEADAEDQDEWEYVRTAMQAPNGAGYTAARAPAAPIDNDRRNEQWLWA